jgi:uncharacterized protein (TIGR04255 family)
MPGNNTKLFPDSERVIYKHAPLVQVICQLRFPPILRIESQPPAEFQERIRNAFPLLERAPTAIAQQAQVPPELMKAFAGTAVTYQFHTEDRLSTLTLASDSISLTTNSYSRWEQFREQFRIPLAALIELYKPSFFSRIGLRYINAIRRETLGLKQPWSELLRREILGEISIPEFEENLKVANRALVVGLSDNSSVLLQHGLVMQVSGGEIAYSIDFDFFTDHKTEVENAEPTLDNFNHIVGRAFRWCITDTLHRALGPEPVSEDGA